METRTELILTVGERFYNNHKKRVTNYQKANPDKMHVKCKAYNERINKEERPEKYEQVLQSKRKYYWDVVKPKRIEAKKKKLELCPPENL